MKDTKINAFYSDIGGIYFGKNIRYDYIKNHYITFILSLGEPFYAGEPGMDSKPVEAVLVFPDTLFKIRTSIEEYTAFIHIDPYSATGLALNTIPGITRLEKSIFNKLPEELIAMLHNGRNDSQETEQLLGKIAAALPEKLSKKRVMDSRIQECMTLIAKQDKESVSLKKLAGHFSLSPDRLSHLFREETGITLKKYIQHRKMITTLHGIHTRLSLTEAAHYGGFFDQSHFIRIFRKMFGILPKKIRP